ncbi:MAG: hypothetical protein P8090_16465 [Gammaproteobacteria bacterium]
MYGSRIRLSISAAEAAALFRRVAAGAHSPAQALAALTALETLVSSFTETADQPLDAYAEIRRALHADIDEQRQRLLRQQAEALGGALGAGDVTGVARVHAALSREAFLQVAERCLTGLAGEVRAGYEVWIARWCAEAEKRARGASPYPDAMDWDAAGVSLGEFMAMRDLSIALKGHADC